MFRSTFAFALLFTGTAAPSSAQTQPVPCVTGESWLQHLGRALSDTSMGKTGEFGPSPDQPLAPVQAAQPTLASSTKTSADLYRYTCRGCHGASGEGAPPEIHGVINPVRATSPTLVLQRLQNLGAPIGAAEARNMAREAHAALVTRLRQGGEAMPNFSYLGPAETAAILHQLEVLAQIPNQRGELNLAESPLRIGELIVRSTCHTCHSATGSNPTPGDLMAGAIPPLSALTTRVNQRDFLRKVTRGAPILMGDDPQLYRGRMPVFRYLTRDEVSEVYAYLSVCMQPDATTAVASTAHEPTSAAPRGVIPNQASADELDISEILVPAACAFVFALLIAGLGFTWHVFHHLGKPGAHRAPHGAHSRDTFALKA